MLFSSSVFFKFITIVVLFLVLIIVVVDIVGAVVTVPITVFVHIVVFFTDVVLAGFVLRLVPAGVFMGHGLAAKESKTAQHIVLLFVVLTMGRYMSDMAPSRSCWLSISSAKAKRSFLRKYGSEAA